MHLLSNYLSEHELSLEINKEDVSKYVFFYAAELETLLNECLPITYIQRLDLSALILHDYLLYPYSVDSFLMTSANTLEFYLLSLRNLPFDELRYEYVSQEILYRLKHTYQWLVARNELALLKASELYVSEHELSWRGKYMGCFVFQPTLQMESI